MKPCGPVARTARGMHSESTDDPEDSRVTFRTLSSRLERFGISESQVRAAMSGTSADEAAWRLMNEASGRLVRERDFERLSNLYFEMALQLDREERPFTSLLCEAQRTRLLAIQHQYENTPGVLRGVTIGFGWCPACSRLDGQRMTLEDAIRLQPLPCSDCTNPSASGRSGWCRCLYLPDLGGARDDR